MTAARISEGRWGSAWLGLALNVLVWPGTGTLFLGRWLIGTAQILLALVGFFLLAGGQVLVGASALLGGLFWSLTTAWQADRTEARCD